MVRHLHSLPKEVVNAPALETIQGQGGWGSESPGLCVVAYPGQECCGGHTLVRGH